MAIFAVKDSFAQDQGNLEKSIQFALLILIQSKFVAIFSLLFGISFSIQILNTGSSDEIFLPRIIRRMTTLFIFGFLHIFLFWGGDILILYSITGSLLILFRNSSREIIKKTIGFLVGIPSSLLLGLILFTFVSKFFGIDAFLQTNSDSSGNTLDTNSSEIEQLLHSNFISGIDVRIHEYLLNASSPFAFMEISSVLAMFLIGLLIGKSELLHNSPKLTQVLQRVKKTSLVPGLILNSVLVLSAYFLKDEQGILFYLLIPFFAGPLLCLGIASTFALIFTQGRALPLMRVFATTGRIALSNYITQSAVLTFLAYGWGFGLATQLNGPQVAFISLALYALQSLLSWIWLNSFRFGPLEWIWRCFTYWKFVSIKL